MTPCTRGPAPAALAEHGATVGREYAQRRAEDPAHRFRWPQRGGVRLFEVAREALRAMTEARCAYCDGSDLDATGEDQVDHFQPKSHPAFYALVCEWTNLFLCCTRCNKAKRDAWDEALLRPDEPDYSFERYFSYRFDTGELLPNAAASPEEQRRASCTIELLALNRAGACRQRQRTVDSLRRGESAADVGYRYLVPLSI